LILLRQPGLLLLADLSIIILMMAGLGFRALLVVICFRLFVTDAGMVFPDGWPLKNWRSIVETRKSIMRVCAITFETETQSKPQENTSDLVKNCWLNGWPMV
jgi:hypothetical protein